MKKYLFAIISVLAALSGNAAEPTGYYSSCEGKCGQALLKALCDVVGNHTDVGYNGLWTLYKTSDVDENGKIWDMYSTKRWKAGSEQCGNYQHVGDCYNREHSLPKSWFDDASPMVSDAFHIYPTDGKVNWQRSNYPFGECKNGTTLSSNGGVQPLGKLGKSTRSGYSGTVFEPDDQYKGDFARTYFYMAAAYNNRVSSWSSDAMAGNNYPVYKQWVIDMLLEWATNDPVSDKERNRQEAIYKQQHNRNPFIDHPELAEHIWGDKKTQGWKAGGVSQEPTLAQPAQGATLTLNPTTPGTPVSAIVNVAGANFTQDMRVSVSGHGFSVTPSTLTASQVNGGAAVTVTFTPSADDAGSYSGTLTLTGGNISRTVALSASVATTLTATPAANVTDNSFIATWLSMHPDAIYLLHVTDSNQAELPGYPRNVAADDQEYEVEGLEASTGYVYFMEYQGQTSNKVEVTTQGVLPMIEFNTDHPLQFTVEAGKPSADATIFFDAYNLPDNEIDIRVDAPFELSTDRNRWGRHIQVTTDDDHFYLRVGEQATPGDHVTSIAAQSGDYLNDMLRAEAHVGEPGAIETVAANGAWEAYNLDGSLAIDNRGGMMMADVYDLDGRTWMSGLQLGTGVIRINLPAGIYIVVATGRNEARRVAVY